MPKELVALAPRNPILRDYEDGPVPDQHVRVKVEYGAPKRGSEMTGYYGLRKATFPMGLGNMCVGHITETGAGVEGFSVGDRVAGHGHLRETHTWDSAKILRMNKRMTWKEAVCYDPAQFALSAIRDGQVRLGDRVAVFGLGAIGLMSAQMAHAAGASLVVTIDPIEKRRAVAMKTGADIALHPTDVDVAAELKKATGTLGIDVAIDTSANYMALDEALHGLAFGGNVVLAGWANECKGGLDFGAAAHFQIPNLIFARANSDPNRDHPRWDFRRICETCWHWLSQGHFQCEEIVQPVIPFAESVEAYQDLDNHPERSIKLGIAFEKSTL